MNLDRYLVMQWDESLRLWCVDCNDDPDSPDYEDCVTSWNAYEPVSVLQLTAAAVEHENDRHARQEQGE